MTYSSSNGKEFNYKASQTIFVLYFEQQLTPVANVKYNKGKAENLCLKIFMKQRTWKLNEKIQLIFINFSCVQEQFIFDLLSKITAYYLIINKTKKLS